MFKPGQFCDTKTAAKEYKAELANSLVEFIRKGFPKELFTTHLHSEVRRLFGLDAVEATDHVDFWQRVWNNAAARWYFIQHLLKYEVSVPANEGMSDVEVEVREWVRGETQLVDQFLEENNRDEDHSQQKQLRKFLQCQWRKLGKLICVKECKNLTQGKQYLCFDVNARGECCIINDLANLTWMSKDFFVVGEQPKYLPNRQKNPKYVDIEKIIATRELLGAEEEFVIDMSEPVIAATKPPPLALFMRT